MACDAAAAAILGHHAYARALVGLASSLSGSKPPAYSLSVLHAGSLEDRIKELLEERSRLGVLSARLALWVAGTLLAVAGALIPCMALSVTPALAAETRTAFSGVWKGNIRGGEGHEDVPGADLQPKIAGGRHVVNLTMYRNRRKPEGGVETTPYQPQVIAASLDGTKLTFRTRDEWVFARGGPKETLEAEWQFMLKGADEAELQPIRSSLWEAAKAKGEPVPPPPPPLRMKRYR